MEYRDQDFKGQDIVLDGNTFTGCTFRQCRVVFRGTAPFTLSANRFKEDIEWAFDGAAALTLKVLSGLYHGAGEGGRKLIEQTFERIRRGW